MCNRSARWPVLLSLLVAAAACAGGSERAYADCTGTAPRFECSGSGSAAQSVKADNADVKTLPGFSVSATNKNALSISGTGQITYTDNNGAALTSTSRDALNVVSTGDDGATDGSVTIDVDGPLTGGSTGISANNKGAGALTIKVGGTVESTSGNGIQAVNKNTQSEGLTIATGGAVTAKRTAISATNYGAGLLSIDADGTLVGATGISAINRGAGAVTIDASGEITASGGNAIAVTNYGTNLSVVTGNAVTAAKTAISATNYGTGKLTVHTAADVSGATGINASNNGSDALSIEALGAVTATSGKGIYAINRNANSTTLSITTKGAVSAAQTAITAIHYGTGPLTIDADGDVSGATGISANNNGAGALAIDTSGTVTGTTQNGISATNSGTDLTVNAGDTVKAAKTAISATNDGTGKLTVNTAGDVTGGTGAGIAASNKSAGGTDLSITTASGTTVSGTTGVSASNAGTGTLSLDLDGDAEGTKTYGVSATNSGETTTISSGAKSTIRGATTGVRALHTGTGSLTLDLDGDVQGLNGQGVYARTDGTDALNLTTGGTVTGTQDGIYAYHRNGGPINVTVGTDSVVTSSGTNSGDYAIQTVGGPTNLTVAGTLNPGTGGAVAFDTSKSNAFNDRLTLHPTAVVNGTVLAGPGTDTLAFGGKGKGAFDLDEIDTGDRTRKYQSFENFEVNSGVWSFSGSTSETFTVNGGVLKGTGTFADLILNGGTIALGNSIGTMVVNGDFTLGSGSVFEVEVDANGNSDKVIAYGAVNLTGSTLRILAQNGSYNPRTDYTIIQKKSAGAVTGKFAHITSNYAFLTPTVVYDGGDGNDVTLTLLRTVVPKTGTTTGTSTISSSSSTTSTSTTTSSGTGGSGGGTGGTGSSGSAGNGSTGDGEPTYLSFCSVAESKNQCNVAEALDPLPFSNPLYLAVLTQTVDGARQAFNALSGEVHATVMGTLVDDSRYARDAVMGRLLQASHRSSALGSSGPLVASYDNQAMLLGGASLYDGNGLADPQPQPLAFWTQAFGA